MTSMRQSPRRATSATYYDDVLALVLTSARDLELVEKYYGTPSAKARTQVNPEL